MSRPQLILPRADAACGKLFFPDRKTADGHRIGLEVWNRATGRTREGYRLAVFRCKRCGGYHIARRPVDRISPSSLPHLDQEPNRDERDSFDDRETLAPRPWGAAFCETTWA